MSQILFSLASHLFIFPSVNYSQSSRSVNGWWVNGSGKYSKYRLELITTIDILAPRHHSQHTDTHISPGLVSALLSKGQG